MRHVVRGLALTCLVTLISVPLAVAQGGPPLGFVNKLGQDIDIRSGGRIVADELSAGNVILPDLATPVAGVPAVPQIQLRGGNVQVNDPGQDNIQIFTGFRPFVHAVQSETSMAAFGPNIVVTYNNSTGLHLIPNPFGPGVVVDRVQLSGFSSSTDGGQTWKSGFISHLSGYKSNRLSWLEAAWVSFCELLPSNTCKMGIFSKAVSPATCKKV